ncbi:sugar transferase [Phreatobacter stygius]|uniref:Sugar transferase n=1 Tax=Phreatobacter stygius TaxID=1940610 RepID=A0A4D7B4P2_9HYPH|nr:sugar transferase [Phreatobacter stygius]QCI68404.1 sugar transferase [Phreatobacter stygius]
MKVRSISVDRPQVALASGATASRCLDILVATTALLLFGPLMLVIAVAIWLEGGRPILFSQLRLGRGGQPFRMYKFRKFSATCGVTGCPLTVAQDNRLTSIGRFLAASKLDELPQLWNVLRGDMAVVGPRPESLAFADCFRNGFERVLDHKPGLLGPCQIQFRNECRLYPTDADPASFYRDVLFPAKARLDLAYFPHRTLISDIGWIIRGVFAVLGWAPRGGTGVAQAQNWQAERP